MENSSEYLRLFNFCNIQKKSENYGQKVWKKCQKQICEGVLQRVLATRREIGEIASDLHTWAHPTPPQSAPKNWKGKHFVENTMVFAKLTKKHYYASVGPAYIFAQIISYFSPTVQMRWSEGHWKKPQWNIQKVSRGPASVLSKLSLFLPRFVSPCHSCKKRKKAWK